MDPTHIINIPSISDGKILSFKIVKAKKRLKIIEREHELASKI
jgi:hypothetical protein